MSRKLFVHIGPPKTGTSAVQNFLRRHDNSVVIYPKAGIAAGSGHAGLVWELFEKNCAGRNEEQFRAHSGSSLKEILAELSSEIKQNQKAVLISSETLGKPYGSCKDLSAFVRALLPAFGDSHPEVEILMGCREHHSWAGSIYNQRVKSERAGKPEVRDPDEFLKSAAPELQYAGVVRKLRQTGFKLTALNYHPSDKWFQRFLNYVGFADRQISSPEMRNTSIAIPMLIAKLAANAVMTSENERRRFARKLKRMKCAPQNSLSIFSTRARDAADDWFSADRKFLQDEFGIRFPARESSEIGFFIDEAGMAEIAAVVEEFGSAGKAILKIAVQYLR